MLLTDESFFHYFQDTSETFSLIRWSASAAASHLRSIGSCTVLLLVERRFEITMAIVPTTCSVDHTKYVR